MYGRDADDTLDWIQEKEGLVSTEDYGHDLESVRTLISKHEGFEVRIRKQFFFKNTLFCIFVDTDNCLNWIMKTFDKINGLFELFF